LIKKEQCWFCFLALSISRAGLEGSLGEPKQWNPKDVFTVSVENVPIVASHKNDFSDFFLDEKKECRKTLKTPFVVEELCFRNPIRFVLI
jgi:hypothetical protein